MRRVGLLAPGRSNPRSPPAAGQPEENAIVAAQSDASHNWVEQQERLLRLARRQLFFIGGAPRSGTTWLQQLLDCHPDICCRGEGLFWERLAVPLEKMMAERRQALAAKNERLFTHTGGYPLPAGEETEALLGTAVMLALDRQCAGQPARAIGEKTPENVFLFPRLKRLFPAAKFIGMARDPRDLLTSAWHFFRQPVAGADEAAAKIAFIRSALPPLNEGARRMLALREEYPTDCLLVTNERLCEATAPNAAELFRFLGVSDAADIVADCVARTSFSVMSDGRPAGVAANGSFLRKGVVGDWQSTLTPAMGEMIVDELGWMFPHFGWQS